MTPAELKRYIRDVPDFPKPGIVFKDITPLLADPAAFRATIGLLAERLRASNAEEILAIESRGFIFGAAVADRLQWPLHVVRKPGKLPGTTVGMDYELEYGVDRVELHQDVVQAGRRYAVVDDLIATGGTAAAVAQLVQNHHGEVACCAFVIELAFLPGRRRLAGFHVESLIRYE
jgi:adenine phosphoribosyltransferase